MLPQFKVGKRWVGVAEMRKIRDTRIKDAKKKAEAKARKELEAKAREDAKKKYPYKVLQGIEFPRGKVHEKDSILKLTNKEAEGFAEGLIEKVEDKK